MSLRNSMCGLHPHCSMHPTCRTPSHLKGPRIDAACALAVNLTIDYLASHCAWQLQGY